MLVRLVLSSRLTSGDPLASDSQSAEIIGMSHLAWPHLAHFCIFCGERFHQVAQVGLKLLDSSDPPVLASQSAGITGISHCAWSSLSFLKVKLFISACLGGRILKERESIILLIIVNIFFFLRQSCSIARQ